MPRDSRHARRVLAAAVGGAVVFVVLALLVSLGVTAEFDRAILLALRVPGAPDDPLGPHWFEETAGDFTALGGYPLLLAFGLVALIVLLLLKKRSAAVFLVVSLATGSLVSTLLKQVFARPRPDLVAHADRVFTSSFPSAHAMVSTVGWLTLAAICIRFIDHRPLRRFVLAVAVSIAVIVGTSRVYLGVHWPTDVLAGWAVGVAWAGLCWLVADRLERKTDATTTSDTPAHEQTRTPRFRASAGPGRLCRAGSDLSDHRFAYRFCSLRHRRQYEHEGSAGHADRPTVRQHFDVGDGGGICAATSRGG